MGRYDIDLGGSSMANDGGLWWGKERDGLYFSFLLKKI
jgi:hypothetical protein